ncbi:DUF4136 domain-containing protein [Catalinimonas sp. 4WD22]|uniref:DUF4136 domain-containing protein n=1 Tax=Catalinimonas locisalis TaxID=3133978 RepID=UPI003100E145
MNRNLFLLLPILSLLACYPEPDLSELEDELVVVTNYSPDADFSNYATFAIPDSIGIITDNEDDEEFVDDDRAATVLSAVRTNMLAAGFTEVNKEDEPDIGVNVIVLENLNVGGSFYPGYWWGYPGYWDPCYWYYCGWYPWYGWGTVYAYTTGTLVVEFIDLKNTNVENQRLDIIWTAYMGEVYSARDPVQEAVNAVNQAFEQSPYLNTPN